MNNRIWQIKKHDYNLAKSFAEQLQVHRLTAALLLSRGLDTEEKVYEFFEPALDSLHPPFLLKDMEKAVGRILQAIEQKEKILIWGDYDVDGTTGTAVLRKAFRKLGVEVDYYIPHRIREGYGLNLEGLKKKKEEGIKVVITVDTGSLAFEMAEWARENNVCLIVTDHHAVSKEDETRNQAYALINPHQNNCSYPNKNIAGVGVAFKLAQAILQEKGVSDNQFLEELIELVAIGTVADVMELTGENRSIVKFGLKHLKSTKNQGLKALIEVAGLKDKPHLSSYNIGFQIAPRINAAGRLDEAKVIVELLETESKERAFEIAERLDAINKDRQNLQEQIFAEVLKKIDKIHQTQQEIPYAIVIAERGWHPGVIGLIASKITDTFHRPSFVISIDEEGIGRGSARSIPGFSLTEALRQAGDLLIKYGGHEQAAGFTILADDISTFQEVLNCYVSKVLSNQSLVPQITIDALLSFKSINRQLCLELEKFEPFGIGNPKPVFLTRGVRITSKKVHKKRIALELSDDEKNRHKAIFWNRDANGEPESLFVEGQKIDVVYQLNRNFWCNEESLQLIIKDFQKQT